jgi:hypothetical protein
MSPVHLDAMEAALNAHNEAAQKHEAAIRKVLKLADLAPTAELYAALEEMETCDANEKAARERMAQVFRGAR